MKKIVIGCDHGGLELKNEIIKHLNGRVIETSDVGTYTSESLRQNSLRKNTMR